MYCHDYYQPSILLTVMENLAPEFYQFSLLIQLGRNCKTYLTYMEIALTISDETFYMFYTQSQIMVEKVPKFSAESLCLHQGMVTSGCWCHMTLLDHVTPVGG